MASTSGRRRRRERVEQGLGREDVVAHGGEDPVGVVGQARPHRSASPGRPRCGCPAAGRLDDPELLGLRQRDPDPGHGDAGAGRDVLLEHLAGVHAVDVVGAEDADVVGSLVADDVEVLEDGVGRPEKPPRPAAHLGRDRRHVVAQQRRHPPGPGDVQVEAVALVLGQHDDAHEAGVGQVGQHEVDEAVVAAERHGRLGPVDGQRHQPLAFAARQDHRQHPRTHTECPDRRTTCTVLRYRGAKRS